MHNVVDDYLSEIQEVSPYVVGGLAIGALNAINFSYRTYKNYLSKNARICHGLEDEEKSLCILKLKVKAKQKQHKVLSSSITKCNKARKPEKCKIKLKEKIQDIADEINIFLDRIKKLEKTAYTKKKLIKL